MDWLSKESEAKKKLKQKDKFMGSVSQTRLNGQKEKRLSDKVKLLKAENKKLIQLLQESEGQMANKMRSKIVENEKMMVVINQIWPIIETYLWNESMFSQLTSIRKLSKSENKSMFLDGLAAVIQTAFKQAEKKGHSLFSPEKEPSLNREV